MCRGQTVSRSGEMRGGGQNLQLEDNVQARIKRAGLRCATLAANVLFKRCVCFNSPRGWRIFLIFFFYILFSLCRGDSTGKCCKKYAFYFYWGHQAERVWLLLGCLVKGRPNPRQSARLRSVFWLLFYSFSSRQPIMIVFCYDCCSGNSIIDGITMRELVDNR